ncbi:MAG: imelysin family protein [Pelagimonas sp.]|jgi:predicted lipoprotein|nr:imelysin family protein [Pelagimonas sp.]
MRYFMLRPVLMVLMVLWPGLGTAQDGARGVEYASRTEIILSGHIIPGFTQLAERSSALAQVAQDQCGRDSAPLRDAFHAAFDAWVAVSHLRFGPTETGDRAFAMAFWPDTKGFTPKALNRLITAESDVVADPVKFAQSSVAGRGFYALEFLLYDDTLRMAGSDGYYCALIRAITADLEGNAQAVLTDWHEGYAQRLRGAPGEAIKLFYNALLTGLQFTADTRLGRPMGSFEFPRPRRAEAWRSGRSLRHVQISLRTMEDLTGMLARDLTGPQLSYAAAYPRALRLAQDLEDPVFAGVSEPQGRIRVEALQGAVQRLHDIALEELGPALNVVAGFNALDGD